MLAPLATAAVLAFTSPTGSAPARPLLVAENAATESEPAHGDATAPAAGHGHSKDKAAPSPRGTASGQNPTGAPNPATPWSGVGANGVSGTNPG